MNKNSNAVMKSQRRKKEFAVEQFGGKCQVCGYNKCINALSFHHIDSTTKKESPSYVIMRRSWERAFEELQKCILVCANCHAEIHYQYIDVTTVLESAPIFTHTCIYCNNEFKTKRPTQKYCGIGCTTLSTRKVNEIPTKSNLEKLRKSNLGWKKIGTMYGISENSMRKWAKKYDLI